MMIHQNDEMTILMSDECWRSRATPSTLTASTLLEGEQNYDDGDGVKDPCYDACDRTALLMGIDNENLEMVELLLENKVTDTILQCNYTNMI